MNVRSPGLRQARAAVTALALSMAVSAGAEPDASRARAGAEESTAREHRPSGEGREAAREPIGARLTRSDLLDCSDQVREVYESSGYQLLWIDHGAPTLQARALAKELADAARKGLRPADYDGARWAERISSAPGEASRWTEPAQARFDVALTVAVTRYVSDLLWGAASPRPAHWRLALEDGRPAVSDVVARLARAADVGAGLATTEPPFPAYRRTLEALHEYERLAREDDGETLPGSAKPIAPGEAYAGMPRLVRLLRAVGDLPEAGGDASITIYEGPVVDAVRRFQRRHGLAPDGHLGPATLGQLNVPLRRRVTQLQLTLQRWRWVPRSFGPPYVVVNIPEFRLHASDGRQRLSTSVVVGNAYRSRTPVFAAVMRQVIFRPWWNVPSGIQRHELAPRIAGDPRLLEAERYVVVDRRGRPPLVAPGPDDLVARLRSGELRLRQRPGPHNALGLVKFVLPNPHGVYLHATPARRLFSRARRDFSHGCIRVEDATGLARWVLRDQPVWTPDRIHAAMTGDGTVVVELERPVPVLIVYGTAVVREDGEVRFFDDLYGYDAELERALADRRR